MQVKIAKSSGFCRGVKHAVDTAMSIPAENTYILGELIHNPIVTEQVAARGIRTVETVGEGKSAKGKARNARRTLYCEPHACWDAKNRWGLKAEEPCDWSVIAPHVPDFAASAPHATADPAAPAVTASQPAAHVVGADATRPAQQAPMAQGPDPFWGEQGAPAGFSPGAAPKRRAASR